MKRVRIIAAASFLAALALVSTAQSSSSTEKIHGTGPTISAGSLFNCVIDYLGQVKCWGYNYAGQTNVPANLGRSTQVTSGAGFACALTELEAVSCWGDNSMDQISVPAGLGHVTLMTAGVGHVCVLNDLGKVTCWGWNYAGQSSVPDDLGKVIEVVAGNYHTCAVDIQKQVRCWGDNTWGESQVPSGLGEVSQLAAGVKHTCAVTLSGEVRCWGDNSLGQISVPADLGKVTQISSGYGFHTCAVSDDETVKCWGYNRSGQLEVPFGLGKVTQIISGHAHNCVVDDQDKLTCWGDNIERQATIPSDLGRILSILPRRLFLSPKPSILGVLTLGSPLLAQSGEWNAGVNLSYRWLREGIAIPAATSNSYIPQVSDYLKKISVAVTGSKEGYISETKISDPVIPVMEKEKISSLRFTGAAQVGSNVSVSPSPRNSKFDYSFQWFRNGSEISGANSRTLRLTAPYVGSSISVQVCALYLKGVANCRTEDFNSEVQLGVQKNIKVSIGGFAKVGRLLYSASSITDSSTATYQWLRNGHPITGATGSSYSVEESDLGMAISLNVTATKPGYETVTKTSNSKIVK